MENPLTVSLQRGKKSRKNEEYGCSRVIEYDRGTMSPAR
jgi:hypothetical protein